MSDSERLHHLKPLPGFAYGLVAAGVLTLVAGLATLAVPRVADALPAYAQQTGLACGRCHVNPAGGGARTAFGNAFAANGHKVPAQGGKSSGAGGAPKSAGKAAPHAVVAAPPPPPPLTYPAVTANPGSYYSSAVNPNFGHVPELSYSNSTDTRLYPFGNR